MPYSTSRSTSGLGAKMAGAVYGLLGLVHFCVAKPLQGACWVTGRLLAPFPWSCRLGAMAGAMGVVALYVALYGREWLLRAAAFTAQDIEVLRENGVLQSFNVLSVLALGVGLLLVGGAVAALLRHGLALLFLRIGGAGFAVVWAYLLMFVVRAPSLLFMADAKSFDKFARNNLWLAGIGAWLPGAVLAGVFLLTVILRPVTEFYHTSGSRRRRESIGDWLLSKLRRDGGDPRFRSSSYWAAFAHVFVLFLIPLLLRKWGTEDAYGVPLGSGNPVVQIVKVKKVKKKKPKKKLVLNMNSPIIFYRPEIDESEIMQQVDDETMDPYVASSLKGKLGKGGGATGGWPHGMANAKVRFLRLEYRGGDWDQDMGLDADYNLLVQFHKLTGFKIADNTEHLPIQALRRFRKDRAPPFVFITGSGRISVSREEIKTLRWYCAEEGGLIFADNGGGTFNSSFRDLMRRVFPELEWVDIANDDILFRQPYLFPNGAPRLWHHSGDRALGLKLNGRWIVFYHQGDLNDAWKSGHSGATKGQAMQAYKLGINVINYAFNQYMAIHFGD